ncbi:YcjF family protein [Aliiroseovarius sp. S1123]|jgi:putative membrane protein|uniref:YcjF family protein n=1 Tax=unclassified Aliiroseovarius TaxID=2623558 RepID=UPI001FF147E0|nr:TIGR01620 family protein [Aliiroseovarius sp. S1123]MCK0171978.1 YcjF family protein [Aliiroseovarius sp. S1123]
METRVTRDNKQGPVLIELDDSPATSPAEAPPVPDVAGPETSGAAMQGVIAIAGRRPSRLARWFWSLLLSILGFVLSVAAYDFVTGLITRNTYLGYAALGLTGAFLFVLLIIALREWIAFARMRRVDALHHAADQALAHDDLTEARDVMARLKRLYHGRDDMRWALERFREREGEVFDTDTLFTLAEAELMAPLDQAALKEVEAAARQVATVTAIVPLALADVATALTANIRMIRRVAEIYGGRSGALGSWRLTRAVMTHLVATGAVAVGDDMLGSLAGGGMLSKLSRRFGEGVVNGALTARVGVAALEVCRPLPFGAGKRPGVTGIVKRALAGLFGK